MKLGNFRISSSNEGDFAVYELQGEAAEVLGSGDARGVEALQLLGNQAAMRMSDDPPRIVVDAEGSSERRESFLERLAGKAVKRSLETKRSVALDPMNAKDRRILHVSIRDIDDVATMSVGTGRYRQVVVVPKGSPEFDEANESSSQHSDS
jgi:spoIIIJ-associated protein